MRRFIQVATAIFACAGFFVLQTGCGGSDDPADPGGGGCGIDITFPTAGASFMTGETLNLRWDASGGGDVRISLLKAGAEQGEIAAATDNDGFYRWTVTTMGATSGDDFGLAVVHTGGGCADTLVLSLLNTEGCAYTTTFQPGYPARIDTVQAGDDYEITWESEHATGTLDIELWYHSGLVERFLVAPLAIGTPDDGSFLWQNVDSFHLGTGDNFYIRLADGAVDGCETESGYFRMVDEDICEIDVIEPLSNSVYDEGQSMRIRFAGLNDSGAVDLYLYAGLEDLLEYIAYDVPMAAGEYNWTIAVPDDYTGPDSSFRVRVVDANDGYCIGFSQKFTIHLAPAP